MRGITHHVAIDNQENGLLQKRNVGYYLLTRNNSKTVVGEVLRVEWVNSAEASVGK